MTDQELFDYITQRTSALRESTAANIYRPTGSEDRADTLLWETIKYFGSALYNKAKLARDKYGFQPFGWAYPDWQSELQQGIAEHLQKGDPRDVAVYAMFAYFHGWSTATPAAVSLTEREAGEEALADAGLAALASISGKLEIEENLDNTSDIVLTEGKDRVFWVAGRVPTEYARPMADAYNVLPGLLARLTKAEAGAASPTRKGSSEWVQVGERLPEIDSRVLVCWARGSTPGKVDTAHFLLADQWERKNMFVVGGGFCDSTWFTHWAPLPTPPQP